MNRGAIIGVFRLFFVMGEKEVKERKPSLMTLKDEVISQHPEIHQMQYEYFGYARELSTLGLEVDKDIITMMAVIRHQETGAEGIVPNYHNVLETVAKGFLGKTIEKRGRRNRPSTTGPLQLNVHDFRKLLCKKDSKSQLGGTCMLDDINYIIERYVPDFQPIMDPAKLSYEDLDRLLMNNAVSFYVTYMNLWDHSRNLESMARRAEHYDPEDVMYTTHFLHNHTPKAMYSAIIIQNILELARSPQFNIDFRKVRIGKSRDGSKINLNGKYSDVIDKIVCAMNDKISTENEKIHDTNEQLSGGEMRKIRKSLISVDKDASGYVTGINGVTSLFGERGFQVEEFQKVFGEFNKNFYPLLSSDFVKKNKNRVHDEYNYAFRKFMYNDIPGWNEKFAGPIPPANEFSDKISRLQGLQYGASRKNAYIARDPTNPGVVNGHIDQSMLAAFIHMDISKIPSHYSQLGQSEINLYSLLGGLGNTDSLFFHDMFDPSIVDMDSLSMITPSSYQTDEVFKIISGVEPGMLVGFGNELPERFGGKCMSVSVKPDEPKKDIELNLSSGAVVTRVSSNQVRVAFADDQSGLVSEVPLFGGGGLYQKFLGSAFHPSNKAPRKNIVFARIQKDKLEQEREVRLSNINHNQICVEDDKPVFILDDYKVHHRSGDLIDGKKINHCVQNARENMEDIFAGNERYIKYGDAKDITNELMGKFRDNAELSIKTKWVDGTESIVKYHHLHTDHIDIISSDVYDHEYGVRARLDEIKNSCTAANIPIVAEIYVDTAKGHKFIAVRGSMGGVTDRYIIDSLRGRSSKNPNNICSARDYFTDATSFYTREEQQNGIRYHDLFIRTSAVSQR